jgi:hypothetical protein
MQLAGINSRRRPSQGRTTRSLHTQGRHPEDAPHHRHQAGLPRSPAPSVVRDVRRGTTAGTRSGAVPDRVAINPPTGDLRFFFGDLQHSSSCTWKCGCVVLMKQQRELDVAEVWILPSPVTQTHDRLRAISASASMLTNAHEL